VVRKSWFGVSINPDCIKLWYVSSGEGSWSAVQVGMHSRWMMAANGNCLARRCVDVLETGSAVYR
jgi:hypothetical protein